MIESITQSRQLFANYIFLPDIYTTEWDIQHPPSISTTFHEIEIVSQVFKHNFGGMFGESICYLISRGYKPYIKWSKRYQSENPLQYA